MRSDWRITIPLVWIFNVVGTPDLFNAYFQGFRFVPVGQMGATYFIPAFVVPALLVAVLKPGRVSQLVREIKQEEKVIP